MRSADGRRGKKKILPNIFVSTVGNKVEGGKICMNCEQVQTQQHYKNLNDDPNQSSACTQTKDLWAEPSSKEMQTKSSGLDHMQT